MHFKIKSSENVDFSHTIASTKKVPWSDKVCPMRLDSPMSNSRQSFTAAFMRNSDTQPVYPSHSCYFQWLVQASRRGLTSRRQCQRILQMSPGRFFPRRCERHVSGIDTEARGHEQLETIVGDRKARVGIGSLPERHRATRPAYGDRDDLVHLLGGTGTIKCCRDQDEDGSDNGQKR